MSGSTDLASVTCGFFRFLRACFSGRSISVSDIQSIANSAHEMVACEAMLDLDLMNAQLSNSDLLVISPLNLLSYHRYAETTLHHTTKSSFRVGTIFQSHTNCPADESRAHSNEKTGLRGGVD